MKINITQKSFKGKGYDCAESLLMKAFSDVTKQDALLFSSNTCAYTATRLLGGMKMIWELRP